MIYKHQKQFLGTIKHALSYHILCMMIYSAPDTASKTKWMNASAIWTLRYKHKHRRLRSISIVLYLMKYRIPYMKHNAKLCVQYIQRTDVFKYGKSDAKYLIDSKQLYIMRRIHMITESGNFQYEHKHIHRCHDSRRLTESDSASTFYRKQSSNALWIQRNHRYNRANIHGDSATFHISS